jgi:hypothetical protein
MKTVVRKLTVQKRIVIEGRLEKYPSENPMDSVLIFSPHSISTVIANNEKTIVTLKRRINANKLTPSIA